MVEMKIKITEDKKVHFGSVEAIDCTCDITVRGILATEHEIKASEVLKKKLNIDRGYEIVNHTSMSNEKILNELFNNL